MSESGSQRNRQVFDALVGRRTGIVRDVRFVPTIEGDADLHHAAATMANAHPGIPTGMKPAVGGAGTTREAAVMAALGEALERYLGSSYHCGQELVQSEAELDCEAIPAATLARFSPQQRCQSNFPFQRVTEETPLRWLMGQRLSDDSPCAVPAFAVYLPYLPERGEPPVAPGISTGLSCGDSYESALLGAACEVIERDALALTWLAGISPPRIDQDWFLDQAGDLLPPRDVCQAYDLTSDVDVPVVLVVCQGEGPSGPVLSVGSACRPDRDSAARKAAMEASQDRVYVRHLLQQDPDWRPLPNFSNVTDFSYHARLYSARPDLAPEAFGFLDGTLNPMHSRRERADRRPQRAVVESTFRQLPLPLGEGRGEGLFPALSPLTQPLPSRGEGCESLATMPSTPATDALKHVIRRLADAGHDGVCVDLTPTWARSLDLHVVKLVVPTLLPLHGDHRLPYLGHPRLAACRDAMPRGSIRHNHSPWPYPHPFP